MTNPVQVTQADRDSAADYLDATGADWGFCGDVRNGRVKHPIADLIAKVRLEALTPNDRIAELEAAVTRLTLALEMERGRGQPRKDGSAVPQTAQEPSSALAELLGEIMPDLNNISRAIEDEGDRCYLGSTNDADDLREIAARLDRLRDGLARTYQEGIEDAAKICWHAPNHWLADDCFRAIRALGTKP